MINNDSIVEMYEPPQKGTIQPVVRESTRPKPLHKGDGKKKKDATREPLQMNTHTVDKIIYPVKTKRGIKMAPK